ncbi:MAG: methylated-DNA--[protein]-cysteine S-methyltransferase [Dehalococcoidia bacterium]|nr:methylated-DNA--[protein]-cysteine S-methyltransferase [Dehalococcoidia bacterium]
MTAMAWYDLLDTPLGVVFVGGSERGVHRIDFLRDARNGHHGTFDEAHLVRTLEAETGLPSKRDTASASETARQLREFFAGTRAHFDLPLAPIGTPWQTAVWNALLEIPFGETTTYGELARRLDRPSAARAVGASVGRNPISLIIPCHRVVGANGALTGYASGLERKRWLLDFEARAASKVAA